MAEEKFGIEDLKKLIIFTGKVEDDIADIAEDKEVRPFEVIAFILKRLKGGIEVAKHAKDIKDQFLDLSDAELLELAPVIAEAYEVEEGKTQDAIVEYVVPLWELVEMAFEYTAKVKARKAT